MSDDKWQDVAAGKFGEFVGNVGGFFLAAACLYFAQGPVTDRLGGHLGYWEIVAWAFFVHTAGWLLAKGAGIGSRFDLEDRVREIERRDIRTQVEAAMMRELAKRAVVKDEQ